MFDTEGDLETRRLGLFVLFAFGIAWATAAVIYATGGLTDSPTVGSIPGFSLTLAGVLLPTTYMFAPGIANVLTRALTGEGWSDLLLRPRIRGAVRYYAAAWLVPATLSLLGAATFYLLFPQYFDPTMADFAAALGAQAGQPVDPRTVALVQVAAALTVAPLVNAVFAFGEEFGWRAYLLPKLTPLGTRRAVLLHGLVWGVWHWPVILMGYEYGFGYPGAPWSGLVVFLVFTVSVGTFLAWVTVRTESVWPAALGHGAVNAISGVGIAFVRGSPNPLLGPLPVGLVGGLPWLVVAIYLLYRTTPLQPGTRRESAVDATPSASTAGE